MSFREIGTILDKARGGEEKEATKEQTEKQSLSTQAYKSFFQKVNPPPLLIHGYNSSGCRGFSNNPAITSAI